MATHEMLQVIEDAEKEIVRRHKLRETHQGDQRHFLALELIADDMTRLQAEIRTIRNIFASHAAQMAAAPRR
jgi:hypothetical protein